MTSVESETAADLQRWIDRLSHLAQIGEPLELAGSGSVDHADAQSWGPDRCIPAAALRHVLTCGELTVDPRGLHISGARFREELNLAHIAFPHPLHFKDCVFDSLADLRGAALKELSFEGCHTRHVKLEGAQISGDVFVSDMEADGAVGATGIQIGGQLVLHKARLSNADGDALSLDNAEITGDVCAGGLEALGQIDATGIQIGGQLHLDKATLRNADGKALNLDNAEITCNVSAVGLEADGALRALGADIGGQIDLSGAKLHKPDAQALPLDFAQVTGGVLADGLEADGAVRAQRANIRGLLRLREAKLRNADGDTLNLDGAEITGDVVAEGLEADGEVDAMGVHIGGRLDFSGAKLRNADGDALNLDFAQVTGGVFAEGLEADGAVHAIGVHVGGQLGLSGAKLRNADRMALTLTRAEIIGDLSAAGLEADGGVRAVAVQIRGQIDLQRARLRTAGDAPLTSAGEVIAGGCALNLSRAEITDNVLAMGLEAQGEVRATGARFGGRLDLRNAKLRNREGNAVNLESASIKRLTLGPGDVASARGPVDITGEFRLYRAAITDLVTDANPPSPLVATGWEVTDIHGPLRSDWAAALSWLETTAETSVQPWNALAAVYERNGQPAEGRRLRFAAANRVAENAPWQTKLVLTIYRYLVGHGYYPLRAFWWLVGVLLVATLIVATSRADFVPTNSDAAAKAYAEQTHKPAPSRITAQESCNLHLTYPCLKNPFTYTLSAVVPTFGNTTSDWTIPSDATNWLTIALPMLKLTAWALTALLAAGVTGILRKT
jgi:uncharacterized protein YjbI with pentapeptide repeats